MVIQRREYERFQKLYAKGKLPGKTYGDAFYLYFKLQKTQGDHHLNNLRSKDDDHAKRSIEQLFSFA